MAGGRHVLFLPAKDLEELVGRQVFLPKQDLPQQERGFPASHRLLLAHTTLEQNLARYTSDSQKCFSLESICGDAARFRFPNGPMLIYLFNPLPESGLRHTLANLASDLSQRPRRVYVLYHNPLLEGLLLEGGGWSKLGGTHQYSIFRSVR